MWISGGNVAMGYYNASEADKDSFKVINGQTWFATGDIGMIEPDGSLRIIGRLSLFCSKSSLGIW